MLYLRLLLLESRTNLMEQRWPLLLGKLLLYSRRGLMLQLQLGRLMLWLLEHHLWLGEHLRKLCKVLLLVCLLYTSDAADE